MSKEPITKMKLYICGDSFCVDDPDYGDSWVSLLEKKLSGIEIKNLASSGASNYLIYLQVKQALEEKCDYLIYHATSSIRQEFRLGHDECDTDSISRYWNVNNSNKKAPMICGSWLGIDRHYNELMKPLQIDRIHSFFNDFVDLPNLVEKNYIFISHTLEILDHSSTRWAWSSGGFEHSSFKNSKQWDFDRYSSRRCSVNLWDYYIPNKIRPWFHVTDPIVHQKVCNQYMDMLNLSSDSKQVI